MKKLLAYIVEENMQFAERINALLLQTNAYETRLFSTAGAYANFSGLNPDLVIVEHEVQSAATKQLTNQKTPAMLVLKRNEDRKQHLSGEFDFGGVEQMAGSFAKLNKLKQEYMALSKVARLEKRYVQIAATAIIALYYATFLFQ